MRRFLSELRLYLCNHVVASIPSNAFRLLFYRRIMGFELGRGVAIYLGARFYCAKGLSMGENSVLNENCRVDSRGGVFIGKNVAIASESCILTADHDPGTPDFGGRTRPVVVQDFCFIGTRAMILPGVTLKRGAVVAAGAVVTRDVESMTVAAGVPARTLGKRNPQLSYNSSSRRLFH